MTRPTWPTWLLLAAARECAALTDMQLLRAANAARLLGDDTSASLFMAVLSGRCEPREERS